jgi:hypothetical protein
MTMSTKRYQSYEEASADYMAQFNALLQIPAEVKGPVTRAAGEVPAQVLIKRADAIADVSAGMIPLAKGQLEATEPTLREGISGQLIAQAAAEFQLAAELLQITEGEPVAPTVATRATRGAALQDAIRLLEKTMATPASKGLVPKPRMTRTAIALPEEVESAKKALREAAIVGVNAITQRVRELSEAIAMDLITQTEWRAVMDGATLLNKDIAEKLEALKHGVGALFRRAVAAAAKTLLNVYNKIMALLGKDLKDGARKQIKEWLEKIENEQKVDLIEAFVDRLYRISAFEKALDGWLEKTSADADKVNETTGAVREVPTKFAVLAGYLGTAENVVVVAKRFLKFPQVLVVAAGIQIALLAVIVYSGYDYIGYRELNFPNLAKGVAQVVQERLVSPA